MVLALQVCQGVINAFDMPARQAFVVEMIEDRADLPNAIALNSSMVNASRILGPSIGGVLIAAVGEGWCFLARRDHLPRGDRLAARDAGARRERAARARRAWLEELARGLRATSAASRRSGPCSLLLALVSPMGMPYTVLMPAIAAKVLHGGPHTLGFLMAASGVGRARRRALPRLAAVGAWASGG